MGDEQISYRKERGLCDTCARFTWVLTQYLGGTIVAQYCKRCEPKEMD